MLEEAADDKSSELRAVQLLGEDVVAPRDEALSWEDYFMGVAFLTAMRSKDPSTQVGACIVNDLKRIIGIGYNGFPTGCPNEALPWRKSSAAGPLETKYPYVVHAELNAVMNKNSESCRDCTIYTTLFPCNECAKVIIQAGIRRVVFASDKHNAKESSQAARRLFALAGVELCWYRPSVAELRLRCAENEPLPEPSPPRMRGHSCGHRSCSDHLRKNLIRSFSQAQSTTCAPLRPLQLLAVALGLWLLRLVTWSPKARSIFWAAALRLTGRRQRAM